MRPLSTLSLALTAANLFTLPAAAQTTYTTYYPPSGPSSEINGSLGGDTARSFIASGMMGAKFFGNVDVSGMEASLLATCQTKTPAGSSWPEACYYVGLTGTLSSTFSREDRSGVLVTLDDGVARGVKQTLSATARTVR